MIYPVEGSCMSLSKKKELQSLYKGFESNWMLGPSLVYTSEIDVKMIVQAINNEEKNGFKCSITADD